MDLVLHTLVLDAPVVYLKQKLHLWTGSLRGHTTCRARARLLCISRGTTLLECVEIYDGVVRLPKTPGVILPYFLVILACWKPHQLNHPRFMRHFLVIIRRLEVKAINKSDANCNFAVKHLADWSFCYSGESGYMLPRWRLYLTETETPYFHSRVILRREGYCVWFCWCISEWSRLSICTTEIGPWRTQTYALSETSVYLSGTATEDTLLVMLFSRNRFLRWCCWTVTR